MSSNWTPNNDPKLSRKPANDDDDTSDPSNTSDTNSSSSSHRPSIPPTQESMFDGATYSDSTTSKHVNLGSSESLPQEQYPPTHGRTISMERRPYMFTLRFRLEHIRWPFHTDRSPNIVHRSSHVLQRWTDRGHATELPASSTT